MPADAADLEARLARSEARLSAHDAIARALSESRTIEAATHGVMHAIGENLGWTCAFFWTPDAGHGLRVADHWLGEPGCEPFVAATRESTIEVGRGLPGRVFETGEPAWIDDLASDPNFPRAHLAQSCGLRTGFAFPLRVQGELLGVLEFFRTTREPVDAPFLALMRSVGSHLGHVVARLEAQRWSAAVLSTSLDAVVSIDHHGLVREFNPAAERMFGIARADAVGRELAELIVPPDLRERHREGLARYVRTGEGRIIGKRVELRARRGDGSELPIELAVARIAGSGPPLFTAFIRDITERVRAAKEREDLLVREHAARVAAEQDRAELERANRTKDEFLAMVSHELRTPLQAILGWATMLRNPDRDGSMARKAAEVIERNANTQARLIGDVLDVSRIVSGTLTIRSAPVDIATIVDAAAEALRPAAAAKAIAIYVDIDFAGATTLGDPDRLQQVLFNLLANAVKFTPREGRVDVRARKNGEVVDIVVSDTGEGIPREFLPFVFDRFRQADARITRRHGGLGLGLAIARHLVELHRGTVAAESAGPGKGATFTVRLPLATGDRPAPDSAAPRARITGVLDGVRALVVDDEEDARELLVHVLSRAGATVTTAGHALDALDAFEKEVFDCVVTDIGMPDIDGFTLFSRWRELEHARRRDRRASVFVAVTAFAGDSDRRRAREAGFGAYLTKPVQPEDVVSTLARLLASSTC